MGWTAARRCLGLALLWLSSCGPGTDVVGSSSSGSGGSGSGEASSTAPSDSSSANTSAVDPTEACPGDIAPDDLECPSQGEVCRYGNFTCDCVCGCDFGTPGEPGLWQCEYAHAQGLLELGDAAVTIDCTADTIGAELALTIDNGPGSSAIAVALEPNFGFRLTPEGGGEEGPCGGLCLDCDPLEPVVVEPGAVGETILEIAPTMCGQDDTQAALCSFCGGVASTTVYWSLTVDDQQTSGNASFDSIPIVCRS